METISYRTIEQKDNDRIADLVQTNLKNNGLDIPGTAYFDPHLRKLYEYYTAKPDKRNYFVAVNEAGEVVGGIGVDAFDGLEDCAELQKLYVDDDYKRMGIGTHLIHLIEEEAVRKGYRRMYLETHSNLQAARRLYEKCGYRLIERPSFLMHETMDTFFIKELGG